MAKRLKVKFKRDLIGELKDHVLPIKRWLYIVLFVNIIILLFHVLDIVGVDLKKYFNHSKVNKVKTEKALVKKDISPKLLEDEPYYYLGHSLKNPLDSTGDFNPREITGKHLALSSKAGVEGYYGVDVSNWQNKINWEHVFKDTNVHPIDFVIVKATQGQHIVDPYFQKNWNYLRSNNKLKGAYHFYSYKDDPELQAKLFIKTLQLEQGDIKPIIDVELACADCKEPGVDKNKMIRDLKLFIALVEKSFKTKPILYTYTSFYKEYLAEDFSNYHFWMARFDMKAPLGFYNALDSSKSENPYTMMWQYTSSSHVNGIVGKVDMSFAPQENFKKLLIP